MPTLEAANVGLRRHLPTLRALAFFCILLTLLGFGCRAHDAAAASATAADDKTEVAEKPAAAPSAVPLPEISVQAEAAAVNLREIGARAAADDPIAASEREFPALSREIDARARENARIISQRPSLELLRNLERNWETLRKTLAASREQLDARIALLDRDLVRLAELERIWKETRAMTQKEQAPTELMGRIDSLLATISRTRSAVETERARALRLQSRVATQEFRIGSIVEQIGQSRDATLARVFERDSPPLWDREALARAGELIPSDSQDAREAQWTTLLSYAERRSDRMLLHFVLFAFLAALLYWARARLAAWVRTEPELQHAAAVVAYPIASALVLALMASRWIYPQAPRLLWAIIGAAALIPAVLVLRPLAAPYLRPLLYAVVAFFSWTRCGWSVLRWRSYRGCYSSPSWSPERCFCCGS